MKISRCPNCGFRINTTFASREAGPGDAYEVIDMGAYDRSLGVQRYNEASQLIALLHRHQRLGGTWLDIGCGVGLMLARAASAGFEPTGVEPDPIARERAAIASRARVVEQFEQLPGGRRFDVVSALDVVEHLSPSGILAELRRIRDRLEPDGTFLVKVPSSEGVMFRAIEALWRLAPSLASSFVNRLWLTRYASPHVVYFNRSSLETLLRRNGFEIVATHYFASLPLRGLFSRLRIDNTISHPAAFLAIPAILACSLAERMIGKTDALCMVARRIEPH